MTTDIIEKVREDLNLILNVAGDIDHAIVGKKIRGNVGPQVTRAVGRILAALEAEQPTDDKPYELPKLPKDWIYESFEWSVHEKKWRASIISYKQVMIKEREYRYYGRGPTLHSAANAAIAQVKEAV